MHHRKIATVVGCTPSNNHEKRILYIQKRHLWKAREGCNTKALLINPGGGHQVSLYESHALTYHLKVGGIYFTLSHWREIKAASPFTRQWNVLIFYLHFYFEKIAQEAFCGDAD